MPGDLLSSTWLFVKKCGEKLRGLRSTVFHDKPPRAPRGTRPRPVPNNLNDLNALNFSIVQNVQRVQDGQSLCRTFSSLHPQSHFRLRRISQRFVADALPSDSPRCSVPIPLTKRPQPPSPSPGNLPVPEPRWTPSRWKSYITAPNHVA